MDEWVGFSGAVTGASAALIGLLIVALSINLRQVVASAELLGRSVLALLLLVVPLLAAVLQLVPQSTTAYGIELLVLGELLGGWMLYLSRPSARGPQQPRPAWLLDTVLPAVTTTLALLVGGGFLAAGHDAGLFALPVLVVTGFVGSLIIVWVLLVEILR